MKSITRQKTIEEIEQQIEGLERIYIVGCGTCATMAGTGGREQVLEMRERLQGLGKMVSGWTVIPTACDDMTEAALKENNGAMESADCLLVMACALGVQRAGSRNGMPVIPALDTLFIGIEDGPGYFREMCDQCGHCLLGYTAGVCPITACHKGLLNGPCGGTNNGKCEIDSEKDCAWTLIYQRLKEQGRLDLMKKYQPPRNSQVMPRPRSVRIS
ncbi:MAG: methylenetetrahydrofolate reductase C-terminal domain-containing protein [Dehalococcoidia bacterium]|nr:methylenetetrahydrofolate reductase C-terminal domain-containing protein [Dehalococcoidia bacterium]